LYGETEYCEKSRLYQPWTNRLYQRVVIAVRCMSKDLSDLSPKISQPIHKANKLNRRRDNKSTARIFFFTRWLRSVGYNHTRSLVGLDAHACQSFIQEIFQNVPPFKNFVSPFPAILSLNFALPLSSCVRETTVISLYCGHCRDLELVTS